MSDLPVGWEWATLDEIGNYVNGRGFKKSEWSRSGRPIIRIQNLTGSSSALNYYEGKADDRHVVNAGDLLISWAATLGVYIWRGPQAVLNQHIFKVESYIDQTFHRYLAESVLADLYGQTHGSGMVHVTRGRFGSQGFGLPPLAEQQRIVKELEVILDAVGVGVSTIGQARRRIANVEQRVIAEASTGKDAQRCGSTAPPAAPDGVSVRDGDLPSLPDHWRWARLHEIADVVGGVTKDAAKQSDPAVPLVPYLRVANVQRGHLDLDQVAEIRVTEAKAAKLTLKPGDVLLNEGGDRDKLGRGWIWEGQIERCIHQNHVFRARIRDGLLHPKLLAWHANGFGHWFEVNGKQSVNLASISLRTIKQLPVPVPPSDEQPGIVRAVEDRLAEFARLRVALQAALAQATALRRSVLADAFAGRLVPQDPSDEPASVLLAGIRAERADQPASGRRGVRRASR